MHEEDKTSLLRMKRGTQVLLSVTAVGVGGYLLAGWSLLDSLYMVVITIFGVGYGEVHELTSPWLKVFTILVIVSGCSALIYILGGFFQMIAEGEFNRAVGKLRMSKELKQLKGHVIVCGYGRIGRVLARDLSQAGIDVVVVDNSEARVSLAGQEGHLPFLGDASQDTALEEAGIGRARALCTVLPNDAMNVFITLTARNLNDDLLIIARGEQGATEPKLLQAGASRVVMPSATSASHMADMVTRPLALDFLKESELSALDGDLQKLGLRTLTLALDESVRGWTVGDLERQAEVSLMVVALLRQNGEQEESPPLNRSLHEGDRVVIIAHREHAHSISLKFAADPRNTSHR